MGHFSYTCQLSGLPITSGVQCAIIPMVPPSEMGFKEDVNEITINYVYDDYKEI